MPKRAGIGIALALVALAVIQAVLSLGQSQDVDFPGNYDSAYYYTVARNLAMGRGVTESMVWHYLGHESPIVRPAGDCWMVGWPIVLGTLMVGFGHSGTDASRICAGLSVLLPMLAFRLSWRLRPRVATSFLAGLLVCAQSRLYQPNVTTDVTLSYQLLVLLGFGTALRELGREGHPARWAMVGLAMSLPMWVRGEGFVGLVAVGLAMLVGGPGDRRSRLIRAVWLAVGAGLGLAPLFLYHWASFGRLNPIPRTLTFWVKDIDELYMRVDDPSPETWLAQGPSKILGERARCLRDLAYHLMIQIPWPLLVSAAAGIVSGLVRRRVEVLGLVLFLVLSAVVPTALVPFFTNPDRLVMHAIPILCVLAASAVADLAELSWGRARALAMVVCGLMAAGCCFVPARLNSQGHFEEGWKTQFRPVPPQLATAVRDLGMKPDDVVLTQDPWQVAAVLDVRAVMIPYDDPDAVEQVVLRYQPRFLLLADWGSKEANPKIGGGMISNGLLKDLGFRSVSRVGAYRWFERPVRPRGEP